MSLSRGEAYAIIELPVGAGPDSIRSNYKRLAAKWHPDKNRGANYSDALWKFKQVSQAYKRLITDQDVTFMTLEEMHQLYQQTFHKAQSVSQTMNSNACDDSHDDCDSCSDDLNKDDPFQEFHTNGTTLTEEEQKKKSEKRKAKKKQRKEKKKLEKQGDSSHKKESNGQQAVKLKQSNGDINTDHDQQYSITSERVTGGSDSENFDANSAFYNKVITKKKKSSVPAEQSYQPVNTLLQSSNQSQNAINPPQELGIDQIEPIVLQSRQLAIRGNELANAGEYLEAIELFTAAIQLDSRDFRFFGNRSYCFDRIQQYDKGLEDAERAIRLAPEWPKGYFRKGRALAGKKMYIDAEQSFVQVLKLDPQCDDAVQELNRIRILQLTDMGFTIQQAEAALTQYPAFPQAFDCLLSGLATNGLSLRNTNIDTKNTSAPATTASRQSAPLHPIPQHNYHEAALKVQQPKQPATPVDVKMDPANPEGLTALWVGNVLPEVSDKKLHQMFSKFGNVTSVRCLPDKFCAFINFKDKESAAKALKNLQGVECGGQRLLIKFPDNPVISGNIIIKKSMSAGGNSSNVSASKKSNAANTNGKSKRSGSSTDIGKRFIFVPPNECFFWRTNGCQFGDKCKFRHVPENKGLDKCVWDQL